MKMKNQKTLFSLLSILLIFGCILGIPTLSFADEENSPSTGLYVTDNIDYNWEDNIYLFQEDYSYYDCTYVDWYTKPIYLAYYDDSNYTAVTGDIMVTDSEGNSTQDVIITPIDGQDGFYTITTTVTTYTEYSLSYNGYSVRLECDSTGVGFYSSDTASLDNFISESGYEFSDFTAEKTFYLIGKKYEGETTVVGETIKINEEEYTNVSNPYVSITDVTGENEEFYIYKITVLKDENFYLDIARKISFAEEGKDDETHYSGIDIRYANIGLVVADWMDWNDETQQNILNENAEYSKDLWADLYDKTCHFKLINENGDSTNMTSNFTVTNEDGSALDKDVEILITPDTREGREGYYEFTTNTVGNYKVTYKNGNITSSVNLHIDYPTIGYYSTDKKDAKYFLSQTGYNFGNESTDKSFYMILNQNEGETVTLDEILVNDETVLEDNSFISYACVNENPLLYKIKVLKDENFWLNAKATVTPEEGDPWYPDCGIDVRYIQTGLLLSYIPEEGNDPWYEKSVGTGWEGDFLLGYREDMDSDVVLLEGEDLTITSPSGSTENAKYQYDSNGNYYSFTFEEEGEHTITYKDSTATIYANPESGLYIAEDLLRSNHVDKIEGVVEYDPANLSSAYFYYFFYEDETFDSNNLHFEVEGRYVEQGTVIVSDISNGDTVIGKKIEIPFTENTKGNFQVRAWYGTETEWDSWNWEDYPDGYSCWAKDYVDTVNFRPYLEDDVVDYKYSGIIVSESEFNDGIDYSDLESPLYWVHGDTVQDVINTLNAISDKGLTATFNDNKQYTINKTGYVSIFTASNDESAIARDAQTVTIPDGIEGIRIGANPINPHPDMKIDATKKVLIEGAWTEGATLNIGYTDSTDVTVIEPEGKTYTFNKNSFARKQNITIHGVSVCVNGYPIIQDMETETTSDFVEAKDIVIEANDTVSLNEKLGISGLDDSALQGLADGSQSLDVSLSVNKIEEDSSDETIKEEIEKITEKVHDNKKKNELGNLQFLDINLNYCIKNTGTGDVSESTKLSELKEDISITVPIPDNMKEKKNPKAKTLIYVIYRIHEGVVEKLQSNFKDGKLTFLTDRFSTYAIAVEEVVPTGIQITKAPTKTSYTVGDNFDKTGMVVSLIYSDGSTTTITDYTITGGTSLAETTKNITISYEDYKVTQTITVGKKTVTSTTESTVTTKNIGAVLKDKNVQYKVTKSGTVKDNKVSDAEVAYQKVTKKSSTIKIPDTVIIDGITYKVTSISSNAFKNDNKLSTLTIGSNVKTIGNSAFSGCKKLKKVTIGKSVTSIGKQAFYNCTKLTNITIGKNVKTIGDKAFAKCSALTKITIPSKVTKIGKQAFYNCKKLKTITIKTSSLKSVGSKAISGINKKATIKVPKKKLSAYKKLFKSKTGYKKTMKIKK